MPSLADIPRGTPASWSSGPRSSPSIRSIVTAGLYSEQRRSAAPRTDTCGERCGVPGMKPEEQKKIVREGYDRLSRDYRADDTPDDYESYAEWVRLLSDRLPDGAPVLDIGCGCGVPATRLLAERFDVTGIDFSAVQIRRAKSLVPSATFLWSDIAALSFEPGAFAAVVSFYAIIHMPLEEHAELLARIASWLRPAGYLLATVGHRAWSGTEEAYLGVAGGRMCWSHADEATYVRWSEDAGLRVRWTRFVPEGDSGHTLVFAQKPPIGEPPSAPPRVLSMRCRRR